MTEPWGDPAPHRPQYHHQLPAPAPSGDIQPYAAHIPVQYAPRPAYLTVGAGGRLGAVLLDGLLIMVTFGIGWLLWMLVTWANGQTPAKQLLGHVVADANTGQAFTWGGMFLREFVIKGLLFGLVNTITFGVFSVVDALFVFRADCRTLHDLVAGSVVRHR